MSALLLAICFIRGLATFGVPTNLEVPVFTDSEVVILWSNDRQCDLALDDDPCYVFADIEQEGLLIVETGP